MYFLITKAYSYEEEIIHCDTVVSIVPNGQLITLMTNKKSVDVIYIRGIDDKAMKEKCRQWIQEIEDGDKDGILSSN